MLPPGFVNAQGSRRPKLPRENDAGSPDREDRRLRPRPKHLQRRAVQEGGVRKASRPLDGAREPEGSNIHCEKRCLVSLSLLIFGGESVFETMLLY